MRIVMTLALFLACLTLPSLAASPTTGQTRQASAPASHSVRAAVARQAHSPRPAQRLQARATTAGRAVVSRQVQPQRHALRRQGRATAVLARRAGPYRQVAYRAGRIDYSQARGRGRPAALACARQGRSAARCGGERRWAWASALPPAAGVQTASCPEGTMATPARGHTTIMRCLPI